MSERYLEDPDVQLMLRVRNGEIAAFDELARLYAQVLTNFCAKFVGSFILAEDLAQDVLLKVLKAGPTYVPTAKFRTWLLTIATNVCLNRKRWQKKHGHLSLDTRIGDESSPTRAENLAEDGAMPNDRMDQNEMIKRVRQAILELPESQRAALILARYHELSYAEIGAIMELSLMAVKSLLNRAKDNLREKLSREIRDFVVVNPETEGQLS